MKKTDVRDIETLEVYYNTTRKIKFADDVYITSLDDIYTNLFPSEIGQRYGRSSTYFSRGANHCPQQRYRSIEDFIKLCKRYFPDVTLKNCFEFLYIKELEYDEKGFRQHLGYCPNIKKNNFRGLTSSKYTVSIKDYSLKDLCPNIGIIVSELLT